MMVMIMIPTTTTTKIITVMTTITTTTKINTKTTPMQTVKATQIYIESGLGATIHTPLEVDWPSICGI